MDCTHSSEQHALFLPLPLQSHVKALLKLSKLLHGKGFHVTFVNTHFNHNRFLKSASYSGAGAARFRFETIPDGLPPYSDLDAGQDIPSLCSSTRTNFEAPLLELVSKINDRAARARDPDGVGFDYIPPVSCIVADGFMSFAASSVAGRLGILHVKFFPIAACGLVGLQQYRPLLEKEIIPLKGESDLTNGYLESVQIDWVPGMEGIRLRDLPTFCRLTDPEEFMFRFCMDIAESAYDASTVVIQTFDALEPDLLRSLSAKLPNLLAIAPLQSLLDRSPEDSLSSIGYSLFKEDARCLEWLDAQKPGSVIYVNFGSTTELTPQQAAEFLHGLANSGCPFLWAMRPDLVVGELASGEVGERGLVVGWCPQERVLKHPSVAGFVTHCGWNSMLESLSAGVPVLCYPFFAEQQTNCWFACERAGVGLEIGSDATRVQVEELVRELLEGEKGKEMKRKAMEWKSLAEEATGLRGSSSLNLEKLVTILRSLGG